MSLLLRQAVIFFSALQKNKWICDMFEFAFCFKDDKLENVCISRELYSLLV